MPELTEHAENLTRTLLTETREELARADGKAQILFAASGVVVGVILGGLLAGDWSPSTLSCAGEALWWIGVLSGAVGLAALLVAIYPRLAPGDSHRITYFEDIRRHRDCGDLVKDLISEASRKDRDAEQLLRLSHVAHRKYVAVQLGIAALSLAAISCSIAGLAG